MSTPYAYYPFLFSPTPAVSLDSALSLELDVNVVLLKRVKGSAFAQRVDFHEILNSALSPHSPAFHIENHFFFSCFSFAQGSIVSGPVVPDLYSNCCTLYSGNGPSIVPVCQQFRHYTRGGNPYYSARNISQTTLTG